MSNKVKEKEEIKEEVEEIEDESTNDEENSECNIDNEKNFSVWRRASSHNTPFFWHITAPYCLC